MRNNKTIEYPHPVLNEYLKDFTSGRFELEDPTVEETQDDILLNMSYVLECPGIEKLIIDGFAKVIVRLTCFRTSYRTAFDLNSSGATQVQIKKSLVVDNIDLQGMIVATQDYNCYNLEEFNTNYFGNFSFTIRKGDVVANEPGMKIKLNTILEKNAAGVVLITSDTNIDRMQVKFSTAKDNGTEYSEYIYIFLTSKQFDTYKELSKKKHLRYGIERFLQSSLILPVIVEAISKVRSEEQYETEESDEDRFSGTVWADSIKEALRKNDIDDLSSSSKSDVEIANLILGDVISDSLTDLSQKMKDWSVIRHEEDIL